MARERGQHLGLLLSAEAGVQTAWSCAPLWPPAHTSRSGAGRRLCPSAPQRRASFPRGACGHLGPPLPTPAGSPSPRGVERQGQRQGRGGCGKQGSGSGREEAVDGGSRRAPLSLPSRPQANRPPAPRPPPAGLLMAAQIQAVLSARLHSGRSPAWAPRTRAARPPAGPAPRSQGVRRVRPRPGWRGAGPAGGAREEGWRLVSPAASTCLPSGAAGWLDGWLSGQAGPRNNWANRCA